MQFPASEFVLFSPETFLFSEFEIIKIGLIDIDFSFKFKRDEENNLIMEVEQIKNVTPSFYRHFLTRALVPKKTPVLYGKLNNICIEIHNVFVLRTGETIHDGEGVTANGLKMCFEKIILRAKNENEKTIRIDHVLNMPDSNFLLFNEDQLIKYVDSGLLLERPIVYDNEIESLSEDNVFQHSILCINLKDTKFSFGSVPIACLDASQQNIKRPGYFQFDGHMTDSHAKKIREAAGFIFASPLTHMSTFYFDAEGHLIEGVINGYLHWTKNSTKRKNRVINLSIDPDYPFANSEVLNIFFESWLKKYDEIGLGKIYTLWAKSCTAHIVEDELTSIWSILDNICKEKPLPLLDNDKRKDLIYKFNNVLDEFLQLNVTDKSDVEKIKNKVSGGALFSSPNTKDDLRIISFFENQLKLDINAENISLARKIRNDILHGDLSGEVEVRFIVECTRVLVLELNRLILALLDLNNFYYIDNGDTKCLHQIPKKLII